MTKTEYSRAYRKKNRDVLVAKDRARYQEKREEILARKKEYRKTIDPEKRRQYARRYYQNNRERILAYLCLKEGVARWKRNNPERAKRNKKKSLKKKLATDPVFRAICNNRRRIALAVRSQSVRKTSKTANLLGCSPIEFRQHLEKQFKDGMCWENYGLWEVDHIRPLASFDLSIPEQQLLAFNFINTQPLWRGENQLKSDQWEQWKQ